MNPASFSFLQGLVRTQSANVLEPGKEYLVQARLTSLAESEGLSSVDGLVEKIQRRPQDPLARRVVEALVTTETSFFRDVHPFETLRQHVFPQLIADRRLTRNLCLWSAACASGQEPYSVAMLLDEMRPELAGWSVRVIASDLSTKMIDRARRGSYSQLEVNRGIPSRLLVKYFERDGVLWRVTEQIRRRVEFRQINLAEALPPLPKVDVVFLRNVLIYLSDEVKAKVLNRVASQLRAQGYLFVGGAETMIGYEHLFTRLRVGQTSCYQPRKT